MRRPKGKPAHVSETTPLHPDSEAGPVSGGKTVAVEVNQNVVGGGMVVGMQLDELGPDKTRKPPNKPPKK